MLKRKDRIHFIGIGGAGMFPMAEILHRQGYSVTGSDSQESAATEQLRAWGISVQIGHEPGLVHSADIVVHTSAVNESNPEISAARKNGTVVMKRAVMLGDLMRQSFSVAVSGTHGKTTTTSLIATILSEADKNPTVVVGGIFRGQSMVSGAMVGDGKILVAEADEYDRSFLRMYPSIAVVTNIEEDHLDIYKDLDDIRDTFTEFVKRVPFYGEIVMCIDDAGVQSIMDRLDKPCVTYGFDESAQYRITEWATNGGVSTFTVTCEGAVLGTAEMPLSGMHNLRNALASIAVATEMGVDFATIARALGKFPGVKRRMEIIGREQGVLVVDDYAHHPTEVAATLQAVKTGNYSRVTVVFQPHLYSRTASFYKEFAKELSAGADRVVLLPIYKARELPIEGVNSEMIVNEIVSNGGCAVVLSKDEMVALVTAQPVENEIILLMGAGDVWCEGENILKVLADRA